MFVEVAHQLISNIAQSLRVDFQQVSLRSIYKKILHSF